MDHRTSSDRPWSCRTVIWRSWSAWDIVFTGLLGLGAVVRPFGQVAPAFLGGQYIYIHILIYIYINILIYYIYILIYIYIYIYISGQSLRCIISDLCGFSGAGLKITFVIKEMDSMTQFWCRKVGLSRLFYVILRYMFGHSKCDWQRAKSAIVRFLVVHSVQTKKNAAFGCPGIY